MRPWRRKPKFTHPCPICQHAGRVYPHGGQHAVRYAPEPQTGTVPAAATGKAEVVTGIGESYECAVCHGRFTRTRSDEAAEAERRATWTEPFGDDEGDTVCDDCFTRLMAWARLGEARRNY